MAIKSCQTSEPDSLNWKGKFRLFDSKEQIKEFQNLLNTESCSFLKNLFKFGVCVLICRQILKSIGILQLRKQFGESSNWNWYEKINLSCLSFEVLDFSSSRIEIKNKPMDLLNGHWDVFRCFFIQVEANLKDRLWFNEFVVALLSLASFWCKNLADLLRSFFNHERLKVKWPGSKERKH